jgi:hypothetical protein
MLTAIAVAVVALAAIFGVLFGLPIILDRYFGGGGYAPTKRKRRHRRRRDAPTEGSGELASRHDDEA